MDGSSTTTTRRESVIRFVVWALVGAVVGFALVIFPTVGALLGAVVLLTFIATPSLRREMSGVLAGLGAICLVVAYIQRRGPGTVCWHTGNAAGCDQYLNPWPWLIAGLALVVFSVVSYTRSFRKS